MPSRRDKRTTVVDGGKGSADALEKVSTPSFMIAFLRYCDEEGVTNVPKIGNLHELSSSFINDEKPSLSSLTTSKSNTEQLVEAPTTVFVGYEFPDRPETLRQLFFKGLTLETGMVAVLKRCAPTYTTLTNLRLENCSMISDMLEDLAEVLADNKNISDLSLDMNPIPEQNYYVLFQRDNRLQFLSLRLCSLKDDGLELLSKELSFKESGQTLIYLNLNHNHITCEGTRHLANALRTNRTLSVVLLAGNYIGDEGAIALAEVLQQFPLTHEEVVMRRHRNLQRIMERNLQVEKKFQPSKQGNLVIKEGTTKPSLTKKKDRETKSSSGREKKKGKEFKGATAPYPLASTTLSVLFDYPVSNLLSKTGVTAELRRLELNAEQEMDPDPHPYMYDIKQFDGEIWCNGNMKLAHLNISHNRIGSLGVTHLFNAVQYQEETFQQNKGIITILLQGNPITDCPELHGLLDLLAMRFTRMENLCNQNPATTSGYNAPPMNTSKFGNK